MSEIYDDAKIQKIIELYKKNRQRDKIKYQKKKDNPDFILQNRLRAKAHYETVYKEKKKDNYENNKELLQSKSLFRYYKKNGKVEAFQKKYPDKYKLLENHGAVASASGSGSIV
tara:strand:- start:2116 stop:2457 length:342 start_codon:yes stop_codon:yes gene_type:complete